MTQVEQLEKAIAALESQRDLLGEAVVETALSPLREKLATLQASTGEEQRKQVTVLFADLVGFTAMSEKVDPEDMRSVLNAYFGRWSSNIEKWGGSVEKYIGDAVMAVFGVQAAREDDPQRAVFSALAMQAELENLNHDLERQYGLVLQMRVGINTGPAVVSTLGERRGQGFLVVGDTVNTASRLQAAAPVGGILISHSTYQQVRGIFDLQPLDPIRVKGKREPLAVYQVLRPKPRQFKVDRRGIDEIETRLVGRAAEIKALQDAYRQVTSEQHARMILLVGETGVGKSRLIYEFNDWLDLLPERIRYFRGRANAALQTQPYSLMRDLFSFRFKIQDSDPPDAVRQKMVEGIGDETAAHFIGQLVGFDFSGSPHLQGVTKDAKQFYERALAYLGSYFKEMAQDRPMVILLEDLHWADESSLKLIRYLDREFAGPNSHYPLLIVCTTRPSLFERHPGWGDQSAMLTRLELPPLTQAESEQLVGEILQKMERVPPELTSLITHSAEGNPYYIEELIKMLIEEEVIVKGSTRWWVRTDRLSAVQVPPTLVGILQSRLDTLSVAERVMLQRAAVVGRTFWEKAVEYMSEQAPSAQSSPVRIPDTGPLGGASHPLEEQTRQTFEMLRTRDMVLRSSQSAFDDTEEYIFKNALMHEVAYEALLRSHRRAYHMLAARWLKDVTYRIQREDEYAALIAGHLEQAGESAEAATWFARAGRKAAASFANLEAAQLFSRALDLAPESDPQFRFELFLKRARISDMLANRSDQAADLQAASALAEGLGPASQAEVLVRQADMAFYTSDFPSSVSLGDQAVEIAEDAGRLDLKAEGYLVAGKSLTWQGDNDTAETYLQKARTLAEAANLPALLAESLQYLATLATNRSQTGLAMELLQQALNTARENGDVEGESKAMGQIGVVYHHLGEYQNAKKYMLETLRLSRIIGHRVREGIAMSNLGSISLGLGHYEEARSWCLKSLEVTEEIGDQEDISLANTILGDVCRETGQYADAQRYYEKALEISRAIDYPVLEADILTSLSQIYAHLGDLTRSEELAQQGLAASQRTENALLVGKAYLCLGMLYQQAQRPAEAEQAYLQAIERQEAGGLENNLLETYAGLASLVLEQGRSAEALGYVDKVLPRLSSDHLASTMEPMLVYWNCYKVLRANHDLRSASVLEEARRLVQERAGRAGGEQAQRAYLEDVPINRLILTM